MLVCAAPCCALACACCAVPPPAFLLLLPARRLLLPSRLSSPLRCRRSRAAARGWPCPICGLTTSLPPFTLRLLFGTPLLALLFGALQLILFGAGTTDVDVGDGIVMKLRLSFGGEAGLVGTLGVGRDSFWGLTTGETGEVLELGVMVSTVLLLRISWTFCKKMYTI